jgi:hypothetical protein
VSLLGCSADTVNMGEDDVHAEPPLPPTSRCRESTTIDGDVLVENQEQLAELEGCTVITGAFTVLPFANADLRPLHALTRVSGSVDIGAISTIDARYNNGVREPWLESLAGLESLESAGELLVSGLSADNVDPLSHLHTLDWPGTLGLDTAPNLIDLQGLRQLQGIRNLFLWSCSMLESLEPLALPKGMDKISFSNTPLTRLTPLGVESADQLDLDRTELINLDAFSGLTSLSSGLFVTYNPELENIDALDSLTFANALDIYGNPQLRRLPEFTQLMRLDELSIYANDSLQNIPTLPKLFSDVIVGDQYNGQPVATLIGYRPRMIYITYNASLTSITLADGWLSAGQVSIWNNDSLTRIDFTKQRSVEQLVLINNASLETIELGVMDTIDRLEVHGNSRLDNAVFDSVRTFERQFER